MREDFFRELIYCIIAQEYAEKRGYHKGFPIPSSDEWVYDRIEKINLQLVTKDITHKHTKEKAE